MIRTESTTTKCSVNNFSKKIDKTPKKISVKALILRNLYLKQTNSFPENLLEF